MTILCRFWRPEPALVQKAVARTNSRDTIYQAEISLTCDKSAPRCSEALLVTASRAVYSTITGGHLLRVEWGVL